MFLSAYMLKNNILISIDIVYVVKTIRPESSIEDILLAISGNTISEQEIYEIKSGMISAYRAMTEHILRPTDYLVIRALQQGVELSELEPEAHIFRESVKSKYNAIKKSIEESLSIEELCYIRGDDIISIYTSCL